MKSQALNIQNLPTPAEESWKYTNLPASIPSNLTRENKTHTVLIHKTRGQTCGQIEDILFEGVAGTVHAPTLNIKLEEGSSAIIVENHTGGGTYWKNMATAIEIGDSARLTHIRIQQDSAESVNTNMVNLNIGRDAYYNGCAVNIGGKLTRHEIHAVLNGSNTEISFNGLNLLKGKQHGDTTILIEHKAPHRRSNQFYRSILDDESRCVFQGKVHVHKVAQKTDGYQLSNALTLSGKAEMDTKPELEIYADDVKCSHGATTGQLDDEPLFYLRTRGLNEAEARFLLVEAFIAEIIEKIGNQEIETRIADKVGVWLQTTLSKQ